MFKKSYKKKQSTSIKKLLHNEKNKVTTTTNIINQKQQKTKLQQKKSKNGKICIGTYFQCFNQCQSSELQTTHGKGRGSTILTKQNKVAVQENNNVRGTTMAT